MHDQKIFFSASSYRPDRGLQGKTLAYRGSQGRTWGDRGYSDRQEMFIGDCRMAGEALGKTGISIRTGSFRASN